MYVISETCIYEFMNSKAFMNSKYLIIIIFFINYKLFQFPDHSSILNRKNAFAEAVLLPCILIIKQKQHQDSHCAGDPGDDGIPCLITFTGDGTRDAYLKPKRDGVQDIQRILLEFDPESIYMHQVLLVTTWKEYVI